jgi:Uma2 family endonuclease
MTTLNRIDPRQRIDPRSITTAEQLYDAGDLGRCELIDGELILMSPVTGGHGWIATSFASRLHVFVEAHGSGAVLSGDPGFQLSGDTVLAPDIAFICTERLKEVPERGWIPGVPDLAIEIVSPRDRPGEVREKVKLWLDHGGRGVWVFDPKPRNVTVNLPGQPPVTLTGSDILSGGDIIPGFSIPIHQIFAPLPGSSRGK